MNDPREVEIASAIWSQYFPSDKFFIQDKRLAAVSMFSSLFRSDEGQDLLRLFDPSSKLPLGFDVDVLGSLMPFPDFVDTMRYCCFTSIAKVFEIGVTSLLL